MTRINAVRERFDDRPQSVAGVAFVLTATWFPLFLMACAAIAPGYEVHGGAISDFGVIAETALLFNATMVLTGLGNALGGYAYYRVHGSRRLLALFGLTSAGSAGVGFFPSTVPAPHYAFALLAFVALNAQVVACSRRAPPGLRSLGVFAGVAGFASLGRFVFADAYGPLGFGGVERMVVYPAILWLLAFGGTLLGGANNPSGKV